MSVMFLLLAAAADAPAPMPAFLTGCWEQREGERWTQECWTEPRAGQMMGSGRSGTGETLRSWEWMRIERGANGALRFVASPNGATPHLFHARIVTENSVEFVDPSHDYPQRVAYEWKSGELTAETSLIDGRNLMRWSFRRSGSKE